MFTLACQIRATSGRSVHADMCQGCKRKLAIQTGEAGSSLMDSDTGNPLIGQ